MACVVATPGVGWCGKRELPEGLAVGRMEEVGWREPVGMEEVEWKKPERLAGGVSKPKSWYLLLHGDKRYSGCL